MYQGSHSLVLFLLLTNGTWVAMVCVCLIDLLWIVTATAAAGAAAVVLLQ